MPSLFYDDFDLFDDAFEVLGLTIEISRTWKESCTVEKLRM